MKFFIRKDAICCCYRTKTPETPPNLSPYTKTWFQGKNDQTEYDFGKQ